MTGSPLSTLTIAFRCCDGSEVYDEVTVKLRDAVSQALKTRPLKRHSAGGDSLCLPHIR